MNRAFVSLYLIIVLSIVLLGLGLNKFWEKIAPVADVDPAIEDLFIITEHRLINESSFSLDNKIISYPQELNYKFELLNLHDFAQSAILKEIEKGNIVNASSENTNLFYKRITQTNTVLVLSGKIQNPHNNTLYASFILLFYSAIAVVIFFWVWPLSRDLSRLIKHTELIGGDDNLPTIAMSPRSILFPFANAFNVMSNRLSEIMHAQKEMTYAVSHELRTPLARMKFALAMTDGEVISMIVKKQLLNIHCDIVDMEMLINSLLAYASFEQQAQELNQDDGHIHDLLQGIVGRLMVNNIGKLEFSIQNLSGNNIFHCQWSLMQTALQNLLENAVGFAQKKILITVRCEERNFIIEVNDDGPGVPEEQRSRIFDSFVRLYDDQNINHNRPGFGLGLAIVKRIMAWHKGSVYCVSSELGGAKFVLVWPILPPNKII